MPNVPAEAAIDLKREVSAGEAIAIFTVAATIMAATYNMGIFYPLGSGAMALLKLEDIFLGASTAFLTMSFLTLILGMVATSRQVNNKTLRLSIVSFGIVACIVLIAGQFIVGHPLKYVTIAAVALVVLVYSGASFVKRYKSLGAVAILGTYVVASGYVLGTATTLGALQSSRQSIATVEFKDGKVMSGNFFRGTSAYIFLVQGSDIVTVPLSEVRTIVRKDAV
jgi:hypothetical protein